MEGSKFTPANEPLDCLDFLEKVGKVTAEDIKIYIEGLKSDKSKEIAFRQRPERQAVFVVLSRLSEKEYQDMLDLFKDDPNQTEKYYRRFT